MIELSGVVTSGGGQAAGFMAIPWVRDGVRRRLAFDPYPGTLNVRLVDADTLRTWRGVRRGPALVLAPPPSAPCGATLYPAVVAPDIDAAVLVPDVTRHADDTLEIIAAVHVRTRLALRDGDAVTLRLGPPHVSRL